MLCFKDLRKLTFNSKVQFDFKNSILIVEKETKDYLMHIRDNNDNFKNVEIKLMFFKHKT